MTGVVIIGAGGHGREVFAALWARMLAPKTPDGDAAHHHVRVLGFLDDSPPDEGLLKRLGIQWLGPIERTLKELAPGTRYLIGMGSGEGRRKFDLLATASGLEPLTLIDPTASIGPDVRLSPGAIVFAGATVTTNITIGRHAHVGRGVAVGHDSSLSDYASVFPNASISGNVTLGEASTVGTGAVIRQGVSIASGAVVGAGAVVLNDVCGTVVGVPARPLA